MFRKKQQRPIEEITLILKEEDSCFVNGHNYYFSGHVLGKMNQCKPSKSNPYMVHVSFEDVKIDILLKSFFTIWRNGDICRATVLSPPATDEVQLVIQKLRRNHENYN